MSHDESDQPRLGRRDFLKVVGVAGVAATLPAAAVRAEDMPMKPTPVGVDTTAAPPAPAPAANPGFIFFDPNEAIIITAIVDTLIPADSVGPGAVEAGVVTYIDRQLAGAYGNGARLYLEGPFVQGTPSQGYQLPYTPGDLIRAGLEDLAAYTMQTKSSGFDALSAADRDAILKDIDGGKVTFATVPSKVVLDHIWGLVQEGYFGDPIYGGNQAKSVWKMIGFPGVAGMYTDLIAEYRNKPYPVDPQSIQDFS